MTKEALKRANEIVALINALKFERSKIRYSQKLICDSTEDTMPIRVCESDRHISPTKDELLEMMEKIDFRHKKEIEQLEKEFAEL